MIRSSIVVPFITEESNFAAYVRHISKFPIISQQKENELVNSWIQNKNLEAAHELVTSHLKLVIKMALKFRSYGLPLMDMISEGNIGLMKAVKKFRPEKGNRLSTYAMWWIKASMQNYIIKSWSMVKIGSGILQKKLFSSVANLKKKIDNQSANSEKIDSILENSYQTLSLNEKLSNEKNAEFIDTISDISVSHEENIADQQIRSYRISILKNAICNLNKREQDIIKQRKLSENPIKLNTLSKKYNVSSERIRQIEEAAINKIKDFVCQN